MTSSPAPARPWLLALYGLGALLVVQPPLEVISAAWPLRFGEVGWRFGVIGSFQQLSTTFVVGVGVIMLAAYLLGHRMVVRSAAVTALVVVVLFILAAAGFALDYVQLRRMVRPELVHTFDMTSMRAGVTALLSVIALAVLGYTGILVSRLPAPRRVTRREAGEGLIVGRG
ncbi:MAG TPA: hypothetical protein VFK36_12910 [Gemmatimonadales bacterium]|nr:hypothetical protein [Gemmatimonadales bacterium]